MTSIFDRWTDLDPALALRRIEAAYGSGIFDRDSYTDPQRALHQIEEAFGVELDDTVGLLDPSSIEDAIDEAIEAGSSSRPTWLPVWADSGVSYENGEAYFNDTLITDLTTIHGANFEPAAVTASGMAVIAGNSNRPVADGAFLARVADFDFSFRIHFDADSPLLQIGVVMLITDGDSNGAAFEWGGGVGNMNVTDFQNGAFNTIGTIIEGAEHIIAGSNNSDGWLSSLNGATAVLDPPQTTAIATEATIGFESPGSPHSFAGTVRSIFFGSSGATGGDVEARSALA